MTKKEKYLDNAQKFLVKGQLDRAIREYEQAVALDPKDVRVRQKFAELLVRANRKEEALREFEVIGKFYADNGFYLKAIAVYKQIQKTNPANLTVSLTLASLNEKQGLIGNALAEYKTVYDYYERTGQLIEGISVLEKMLAADKENITIRIKLADTRHRAGMTEQAYDDFITLASELKERGDETAFSRVCERMGQLFPDRKDFLLSVAEGQLKSGKPSAAIPLLKQLATDDRLNPRALLLLAEAARAAGDGRTAKAAYGRVVQRYPAEIAGRKGLISCLADEGNIEEGLRYLRLFEADLLIAEPEAVEGFYRLFAERAPDHPVVAETLKNLGRAVDNGQEPTEEEETAGEPSPVSEETATPVEASPPQQEPSPVVEEAPLEEAAKESPWDEEIDISFDEDELSGDGLTSVGEAEPPVSEEVPEDLGEEGGPVLEFEEADEGVDLPFPDAGQFPEIDIEAGTEEVELDISHFGNVTDDWLSVAGSTPRTLSAEMAAEESLSLDFTDEELDALIPPPPPAASKRDKYGLDGLFSAFKKGVGEQLDQGDTETHYNLGIAYKEMGLYDDAIAEFRSASLDPLRRVDCVTLQGICCREKGDYLQAEELFRSGRELTEISEEEFLCLSYELALLHEVTGACEQALAEYREIYAVNSHFRDTVQKIARLKCDDEALDLADIELVDLEDAEEGMQ